MSKRDPSSHRTPEQIRNMDRGYNSRPDIVGRRVKQNQARATLAAEGKVHKGDGKDVGHLNPLRKGGSNKRTNLAVQTPKFNRGWEAGGKGR